MPNIVETINIKTMASPQYKWALWRIFNFPSIFRTYVAFPPRNRFVIKVNAVFHPGSQKLKSTATKFIQSALQPEKGDWIPQPPLLSNSEIIATLRCFRKYCNINMKFTHYILLSDAILAKKVAIGDRICFGLVSFKSLRVVLITMASQDSIGWEAIRTNSM